MRIHLAILVTFLLAVCGCGEGRSDGRMARTTADEKPAVYVDVRTPEEFAAGHVRGAVNIPHTEMEDRWQELQAYKDKPIVVYCRTGRRSALAEGVLEEKGFTKVENGGRLSDLESEGVPVTR